MPDGATPAEAGPLEAAPSPVAAGPQAPVAAAAPMGQTATSGMLWMVGVSVFGRAASFIATIVLGWILSDDDFGLYAIAASVAGLLQIFREGGLREVVIHREGEWERLRGGYFWILMSLNVAAAAVLLAATPAVVAIYGTSELIPLMIVIAIATPLPIPAAVLTTKLMIDLRFRDIARIQTLSGIIRQAATVGFALAKFGPLSFVLPLIVSAAYESAATYAATREQPWRSPLRLGEWRKVAAKSGWAVAGALVSLLIVSGDYLVLGVFEQTDVVGVYYFGFQLANQVHSLVLGNLQGVLFPVLSKLKDDAGRFAGGMLQAQATTAFIVYPATFGLAVVARPLEQLIWHGKWAAAVPVIQVLCLALPLRIVAAIERSVLEAHGSFRTYALAGGIDGLANMLAAGIGAAIGGLRAISISIATYIAAASVLHAYVIARRIGSTTATILAGHARPMAAAGVAAALAVLIPFGGHPLVQFLVRGVVMVAAYGLLARFCMADEFARVTEMASSVARRVKGTRTAST